MALNRIQGLENVLTNQRVSGENGIAADFVNHLGAARREVLSEDR